MTILSIINKVGDYYGVNTFEETRKREVSFARQVAIYSLMVFTTLKLKEIGGIWGMHHASIIHANKQVRDICRFNPEIRKQIIEIESQLE